MDETPKTGIGQSLRLAREAANLTEKDVAARLNLSFEIIQRLEQENFTNGPALAFICGYLRAYARLMNISSTEINQAIATLNPSSQPVDVVLPRLHKTVYQKERSFLRWAGLIFIIIILLLSLMWQHEHNHAVAPEKTMILNPNPSAPTVNTTNTNLNHTLAPQTLAAAQPISINQIQKLNKNSLAPAKHSTNDDEDNNDDE